MTVVDALDPRVWTSGLGLAPRTHTGNGCELYLAVKLMCSVRY